jgi:hypothetical protein
MEGKQCVCMIYILLIRKGGGNSITLYKFFFCWINKHVAKVVCVEYKK